MRNACEVSALEPVSLPGGRLVERYRLCAGVAAVEVLNAGCAITRLELPDREGRVASVVLSYAEPRDYLDAGRPYFGVVVGRVANRIARGRFRLGGPTHQLPCNEGGNHLHGGRSGFDRRLWRAATMQAPHAAGVMFTLESPDGDEGYPGRLVAQVTYELHPPAELHIRYAATTDAPTIVNLTQHSYFNLRGAGDGNVLQHVVEIDADSFCAVDDELIPTGELRAVDGGPFDFRRPRVIGSRIAEADPHLAHAGGYDHCMVLEPRDAVPRLREACRLHDPVSGRRLVVATDQPGLQFYTGNFLDGTVRGPGGARYGRNAGLCLETQALPDAPNHADFPSIVLEPGQRYEAATAWRFDVLP